MSRSRRERATLRHGGRRRRVETIRLLTAGALVAGVGLVIDVAVTPPVAEAAAADLTGVWSGAGAGPWTSSTPGGIGVSIAATAPTGGSFNFDGTQTLQPAFNAPPDPFPYSADYVPSHESYAFTAFWGTTITNRGTMTVTFSEPVLNPILHLDRLGGTQTDGTSNSSSWEVVTPGATLTKLAGVDHLDVGTTTFVRTPGDAITGPASCGVATADGTACGSIQINGVYTQLDFEWFGAGNAGVAAADGIEFTFEAIGIPVVNFSKTSDATSDLVDGQVVEYTLEVENTTSAAIPTVELSDLLPSGMVYVPESTFVTYVDVSSSDTVLFTDTFNSGTLGPWNADSNGSTVDVDIQSDLGSNRLHFQDNNVGAWRSVPDLTPYDSATLSFDFRRVSWEGPEQVDIYGRADVTGESTTNANCDTDPDWILLGSITRLQTTDPAYQGATYNLPPALLTSTAGVCLFTGSTMTNNGDDIYFDNISVTGTTVTTSTVNLDNVPGGATPDLVDGTPEPGFVVDAADAITLDGFQTLTATFQAVVDLSTLPPTATEIVNNSTFDGPNLPTPETASSTDPISRADISVIKSDDGPVAPGGQVTYTIAVANAGPDTASNVVVIDTLDPNLSIDSVSSSQGGCTAFPCALGDIALNGSATVTVVATASAASPTAGTLDADANEPGTGDCAGADICNEASATSDSLDPDPTNNADDEPTDVLEPGLSIAKSLTGNADEDGSGDVSVGDTLTYTVTATNSGGTTLTNVVVNDDLITPGTTTCATVPVGGTCPLVGTYVVTAADVAAGSIVNNADADSDETGPETTDLTVPVPSPSLAIDKPAPANADEDGSGDVSEGDTLTYTITATNNGTANLTNVVVSDPLITVTGGTAPCASVAPAGTCTLIGTYVVTPADVAAGQIDNTATADSDQTGPVTDDETVVVPTPTLTIDKPAPANADEDGSGDVSEGDTLTYTITATNTGTANLTDVVVSDPLITPTGGTTPCTLVAPAGTCTLIGTYVVTAADVAAGSIDNTATADSDQTGPVTDDETVVVPTPTLTIDKPAPAFTTDADASGDISEGDTLTYTITATNSGTANLTDVVVSDPLITPTGGTTPCTLVAPAGTCTLIGTYVVTAADVAAGQIDNTATADADQVGAVTDDETVPLEAPDLSIDKPAPSNADEDGSGDVSEGDTLTYTITATNNGTANLTDVVVSDPLITPTGGTTPCTLVLPGGVCTLIGAYVVTAADVAAGQIDNTATADSDQTGPVTDDETVVVPAPALSIDKPAPSNADEDGSGDVSEGDTLTYTITATNSGAANLTNVVVSDPLITATGGTTPCALVVPGDTCTLIGTYVVTAADVTAGSIDNTATADADQTGPVTDDETVVVPAPALSIDKPAPANADEDGSGDVSEGDTLTYTITATNSGAANLTNVVVSDPLITATGGTTPCALVLPGDTCTLVGTYVVTAADVTAGSIDNTATADADQAGPVTDDETVPVPTPTLAVDKPAPANADEDGSGDVSEGDTLTYTITATNSGTANLTNVVVSDPLITPTGGTAPCALVLPGDTCTLVGTYVVTAADVTAGSIDNTATADSDQAGPVTDDETVPVPTPTLTIDKPAPAFTTDADASGDISEGDTLTYTITATNSGTANLTDVVVSDPLITPTGGTTPCGLVLPGDTCTLVGTYVVTAADVTAGSINNTATADSDQTGPVTDDETVVLPAPVLTVDKPAPSNADEDGSGDVSEGDTLTYTITATNSGTSNLTDVVVSDPLITATGGTTPCALMSPGDTCTLVGTYVVTAADVTAGSIDNTATADSDQTGPVTDDESVTVPSPVLTVDKPAPSNADEDGSGDVSLGDTLTYTITATNSGTANLTNVVVSDSLISPTGGTTPCALVLPGDTCTLIGTSVVGPADVIAGSIDNTGTADSDQTGPVTDDESTPIAAPDLDVDKPAPSNADEDGSGDVSVGDTLTYTITMTNSGTANLTNVVVSDPLITPTGGTAPCASVLPGGTCTLIGTYVVTTADVTAGSIDNTATADSDQTPPDTDDETTPVPTPDLSIDKPAPVNADEDGSGDVSVGDTLTYTITASNSGTANLTNIVVSDPLITPTGGTTPCASVTPGGTCTLIGTYVVTAADVTAGSIDNTATADSDQTGAVTDDETVVVPTPALAIDKPAPVNADEDGSGDVSEGDTLTYTITTTNTGTANLTNVVISDPLITVTGGTAPCALVAPGDACTLVGTYVVTAADVTAGSIDNTATTDSDQTGPDTDDETVLLPTPDLSIDKPAPVNADEDGSGDVSEGDTLTYTITATNTGAANLTDVVVSDPLITPTGGSTPCTLLNPGDTCTLIGTYVVTAADVTAGSIDNTGTADADQIDPVTDDETVAVPTPTLEIDKPAPALTDDADGSGDISDGDTLTYTITATNAGTANLTNVVVTDPLITPTGGTTPCALVLPGDTCTLVGTYVVTAADVTAGSIDNTATADSDQTGPVTDDETTPVLTPALAVDKPAPANADEDGSGDVSEGDTLTYTITATNTGGANLTNVVVSDPLITPTGGTTPCALVSPGDTCTLVGTYVVTAADVTAGSIDNTATADADQVGPVTDDETVSVPTPALSIDKPAPVNADEDGSGDVSVGDTLTYTITATNAGTANLTNVVVSDPLITATGGTTPCATVTPSGTCTLVGTYVVTAADVAAGSIDNTATADSDQTPPVTDDETTPAPSPALTVDKPAPTNADEDGSGDVSEGDTLTYTITATNNGTASLTGVVVSDPLITPTGGTTPCALVLPAGTCTLIGTYVVTAADVTAGQIDNTATADSVQTDPVTDDETVLVPTPELSIDKPAPANADEDGSGDVSVGDTLTYTITATNTGGANLTNVVVSDPLITPTGGTSPCALLTNGDTCTLVGTYVVTPADLVDGSIDNTATADSDQTPPVTDDNTVVAPTPTLSISKPAPVLTDDADASGDVSEGDTLTYTITATNTGGANLTNVVVSDPLITPTGGTTPCPLLLTGDTCTLVGTYVVTAADVTAGTVDNTATADSDQTLPVTADQSTPVPNPELDVDKPAPANADEDGSGDVSVGDTLTYTITATNTGTANLTNVVVSDPLVTPTGGTTPCASVAPGDTCTLIGTYVVTVADQTAGQIDNTGTADSDQTGPVTDDETTPVTDSSLDVDKPAPVNADEDGSGDVSEGDTLTYTITATNAGGGNLTNVVVSDPLITPTGGSTPCALVASGDTCTLIGTYVVTAADVTAGSIDNTGTADSDQTDPVTDDETTPVPTPVLTIDKAAPALTDDADGSSDISAGDTLTYTITATNAGTANLTNVVVSDPLITPSGGSTPCALVAPGGTCTLIGTYVVTAADVTAGQIVNTATADSDQTPPVDDTETTTLLAPVLVVDKPAPANADEDGSGDVSEGDTLTYTITATNTGTSNLTDVVVLDPLITVTGGTSPCATVLPGGTCTLVGTYVVTAADVTAGQIVNTATADSDQTDPVTDDETTPLPQPGLSISKGVPVNADEDGSTDVSVGDTLTYTVTATNIGGSNLTNVTVADPLVTPTGGSTPCALLAPGATCTLIGTYVVTAGDAATGSIENTATADSDQTDPVMDMVTTPVPLAALVVVKPAPVLATDADASGDISAGDTLTYTITATNVGGANLTDVIVSDPLITATGGTTPCPLVASGDSCTLVGDYVVTPADVAAGTIDNTATADSVQTGPTTDDESTPVPDPDLIVVKDPPANADEDGSGDVSVGDTLTYTITMTNTGGANLTDVVVSDSLITPNGGTTPCTLVAPGGTCTLVGTYVVTAGDVTAGSILNTATADSDQTDPETADRTTPAPSPDLGLDKPAPTNADEDGSGDVSVGDTLTYTITATNNGTANLTNVVVTDDLITPTGGTTPCATVLPTETCTLTGTYVVTPADVTAGRIDNLATADSDQTGPVTDDVTVTVQTPVLEIVKSLPVNADEDGSGDVSVGDTLTYTITATNGGGANLTGVVVTDDLISPTGGTTPCALVAPTETCTLIGTYVVTPADVADGTITNLATADSVQTDPVDDSVTVPAPIPAIEIVKPAPTNADEDGSGDISAGDTLTYTLTATNTGGANLTDVVVSDDLITPTGGSTPCALVLPGETCTLIGTYVVTTADVTAGQIVNNASVSSVQSPDDTTDRTTPLPNPSLVIDKSTPVNADEDGSSDVSVGDTLTYTITATNNGTANLTNVVVADPLITPTGGTTPCALLAPAATCTLTGTYVVTDDDVAAGLVENTATADTDQTDPVEDTETTPAPRPELTIEKPAPVNADEDGSGDVSVGDTLTYTITATNTGAANLTDVVVSDPLVTPIGGTTPCGFLVPGATCTLVGTYVVTADDVTAGEIVNVATADSDQTPPVEVERTVPVATPDLAIDKPAPTNADEDGSGDVSVGDTLTYTITATNTGTATLTNVTISDPLITVTGGSAPCASLAPGETCTLVGTYVVTAADVTAGEIENTASADSDQTLEVSDDQVVTVPQPELTIDKPAPVNADEDASGSISTGDTLTYTITVTNTGTATLTNVTISDPLITVTGGSAPCASLAPGETCTLVGTYVVTAADVTAGEIENTATAESDQTDPQTDTVTVTTVGLGSINGLIWVDRDRDGVRDQGEPSLSGVTVVLQLAGPDGIFGTADDTRRSVVTTNGEYRFDNVPFGVPARVAVDPSTLPTSTRRATFDLDGLLDNATVITLTATNPTATAVNFGYTTSATVPSTGAESVLLSQVAFGFLALGAVLVAATRRRLRW